MNYFSHRHIGTLLLLRRIPLRNYWLSRVMRFQWLYSSF